MCLGTISVLVESWDADGTQVGRLDTGEVVSLAFVPDAHTGAHLLVHLGIPVEVLDPADAEVALALRSDTGRSDTRTGKGEPR
jgi:hydrogenase maturation factor